MKMNKNFGIALIVIGAAMLFFSNYIAEQVTSGKMQIQDAQSKVNKVDSIFSKSKYTDPIGKQITGSANKKIARGQADVDKYESIANGLKIGGIALIVAGVVVIVLSRRKQ